MDKVMTLNDLLLRANEEMWVGIEGYGEYWTADYVGEYEPVMKELRPILGREVEEYWLETFEDPDRGDSAPILRIALAKEN